MSMPTTGRSRGFTLIELIVAIAIVAVLAAILFPVLASVRNNARKVECISHLKYIGVALRLYTSDHAGYFPNWCCTNPNPNGPPAANLKDRPDPSITTWDMTLGDYLGKPNNGTGTQPWQELVRCPANPVRDVLGPGATAETCRAYTLARQTQQPDKNGNFYGGYVALIPSPAATVMIFEKGANLPGSWGDALGENVNQSHGTAADPTGSGYQDFAFHFGGKNILFVDGNVKWILKGTGPYLWNPTGGNGAGACERWGVPPTGDWPPL